MLTVRAVPAGWGKYSETALISTSKRVQREPERGADGKPADDKPKSGLWHMMKQIPAIRRAIVEGYEELVRGIIRPPRTRYDIADLGETTFRIGDKIFQRTDFDLTSTRGLVCWQMPSSAHSHLIYIYTYKSLASAAMVILARAHVCRSCAAATGSR